MSHFLPSGSVPQRRRRRSFSQIMSYVAEREFDYDFEHLPIPKRYVGFV